MLLDSTPAHLDSTPVITRGLARPDYAAPENGEAPFCRLFSSVLKLDAA
jgi:hypothetical protein